MHLIDIPGTERALEGIKAEILDCAFPTIVDVKCFTKYSEAFDNVEFNFLNGAKSSKLGEERASLLDANGKIFVDTGKAINDHAHPNCRTVVVGNPANTNALLCANHAPRIPRENFTALTRLDQNRSYWQLAKKIGVTVNDIDKIAIWGNHSSTMYPDLRNATSKGKKITSLVSQEWREGEFIDTIRHRFQRIIELRGISSAASAGNSATDHMRDWVLGSDHWQSIAFYTDGKHYGIPEGLMFSMPCTSAGGKYKVVEGIDVDDEFTQKALKITTEDLLKERHAVEHLMR